MAKSLLTIMKDHLEETLSANFDDSSLFIIGVSGGPDSMALLYLMHLLGRKVFVVHVNYGKRGPSSDKDQELVEQMAFSWGFESCSVSLDPADAEDQNFQNWAREQRCQFFRDLKENYDADAIVTAHHKDDQVETILQKIFRGSAPTAWQGMKTWDGEILRPLLPFDKDQILKFCDSEAIPFRLDESNEASDFARNFIRNELSDKMDKLFPGWQQNLLALSSFGSTYEAAINYVLNNISGDGFIHLAEFKRLDPELKKAVLKRFIDKQGLEGSYSKQQLHDLSDIETLQTGKSIQFGSYNLTRDRDLIRLHTNEDKVTFEAQTIDRPDALSEFVGPYFTISESDHKPEPPDLRMDASKITWPLEIRRWEHGDVFTPLGLKGSQKISDHLTNRKVPTISRENALVLCGSDSTIYAIIYPENADIGESGTISDSVKCDQNTKTYLTINF
jgi:tRNA(Ile)-lysidine synthase